MYHQIANGPFAANTRICNIFNPQDDCINVNGDKSIGVTVNHGEPKVYIRQQDI